MRFSEFDYSNLVFYYNFTDSDPVSRQTSSIAKQHAFHFSNITCNIYMYCFFAVVGITFHLVEPITFGQYSQKESETCIKIIKNLNSLKNRQMKVEV